MTRPGVWLALLGIALLFLISAACTAGEACDEKHTCDKGFVCVASLCRRASSLPSVAFAASDQSVSESVGGVTITVSLSAAVDFPVSTNYSVSGTATNPADHNLANGTVTISPGQTSASITLNVVDDAIDEADETVVLTLESPTNANLGETTVHTVTIIDNDPPPTVSFSSASQTVAESVGTVTITASLSAASSFNVSVPYIVSGTATNPADHNLANGTITIPAGSTSANITFAVVDDAVIEGAETIILTLGTPANAALGGTIVHTVTITDNDPTVAFSAASQTVAESTGSATVTLALNAASALNVTVPYTVSGTATNPGDHSLANGSITIPAGQVSANLTVPVADDGLDEADETIVLTLGTPTNAFLGATSVHTITITDNDPSPTVSFASSSQTIPESVGAVSMTINLNATSGREVSVPFTVSGTATNPADHNLANGTLTIPAGQLSGTITFNVVDDASDEPDETVIVTLGTPTNAVLGATTTHTVTITDNDPPPTVAFTMASQSVAESVGTVTITVNLSSPSGFTITVPYTVSGTAAYSADHNLSNGTITIPAGQTSANVTFTVVDDGLYEPNETVILTLGTPTNATLGATTVHTVTITNNDPVSVAAVAAGGDHTCVLLANGKVRCWGQGQYGQLGYGNANNIGDNELPSTAGDVNLGGDAVQISAGGRNTCAVLTNGKARCWGYGSGALGYGNWNTLYSPGGDLNIDGGVAQIAPGGNHTCALLSTGKVRCWGYGTYGQLGYGNTNDLSSPGTDVSVGGTVVQIVAVDQQTCALLSTGKIRCWGVSGALGYGPTGDIGDNELPSSVGDVNVGGTVVQVAIGGSHTCAVLSGGTVRCWGFGYQGQLGYGTTTNLSSPGGDVNVGGYVSEVTAGNSFTCALLSSQNVRCWGDSRSYGNLNGLLSPGGDVSVGGNVSKISAGRAHICALLTNGKVRCWGDGDYGKLGYGNTNDIGDNELPSTAGDVQVQ